MRAAVFGLLLALNAVAAAGPAAADSGPGYQLAFRFVTGGRVLTKPAVDHRGVIYLLSEDRTLYSVSSSGAERWRFPVIGRPTAGPVIAYDGTVLAGTAKGELFAVGPGGRLRFRFSGSGGACLTPALGRDGSIYLPTEGGMLYCLSYAGRERWRYQARAGFSCSPAVGWDGSLYLGTGDGHLLALSPEGLRLWELKLPAPPQTPAIGEDGTLFVGAAGLHAVSPQGVLLWSYTIPAPTTAAVIGAGGQLVLGAQNGRLYALDQQGGRLWDSLLWRAIGLPPAVGPDGILYASTASTALYAVSPSGRLLWRFTAKQAALWPAIGREGLVLLGAEDWILYALRTGPASGPSIPLASPWPEVYHDGQNTGRAGALSDLDSPAALILGELTRSGSAELKLSAMADMAAYLRGERYLPLHLQTLEQLLGFLAGESVLHREYTLGAVENDFPAVRAAACELLGELASEGARELLLQVLGAEQNAEVRLAALRALGSVGIDPDGELARAILTEVEGRAEERFLLAAADALYRIIGFSRGAAHPDCYRALGVLSGAGLPRALQERAAGYLRELARQRGR
jgi:outer membrane protein assembly factor BamB